MRRIVVAAAWLLALSSHGAGCAHDRGAHAHAPAAEATSAAAPETAAPPPAMLDALFAQGRITRPLAELMASSALAEGESFKIVELGRDASASHHIVSLRDQEPVHRHDWHDLLVFVLAGHGRMLIGEQERAIGAHSVVYIPRGAVHSMRNGAAEPIVGYAVFTPPFDGQDRVLVEAPAAPAGASP